ncbi:deoxyribodipyrimidine photo-lyase [Pseudoroseomonas cervicalis]|uniref:cryptochrome/photolyase family protein n=1 Tax=Teichococcus cervicalis TaxID=204525 RepID=UPI0027889E1D|nr:deoxyribodipyrimidine photo-lyase [Pseudoroseomonas cervicalis]MDQ1078629.1 deoxyribodipyrimidine photo-lyase [Pseudoroseomonas cervicalis]
MSRTPPPALLWLRQDLRTADHPALHAVAEQPVLPVYVLDESDPWAPGGAARWWLHHSLDALGEKLAALGAPLLLLRGKAADLIPELAEALGATEVHASRLYEPWARQRDAGIAAALEGQGRKLHLHSGATLLEPHRLRTGQGKPYSVYTPFARAVLALGDPPPPIPAPKTLRPAPPPRKGLALEALDLLPRPPQPDWAAAFPEYWTPGEAGAAARLRDFAAEAAEGYERGRDIPGEDLTARLSPHLHWGEVSPRQAWHAVAEGGKSGGHLTWLKEILWREFAYHTLWHRTELPDTPLRPEFADFPWQPDDKLLQAWQQGQTGYPIVDAGLRQLWRHGWMHNRVRMVVGSLLVKHLLQPWQQGSLWFWDTLVDADLAANSMNWQWVAGSGIDASPYFRIFNPILQGEKFDPEGRYVRHFVPELARLPDAWLHKPWQAPPEVLRAAGLRLGQDYPAPIVDHEGGRKRALAALQALKAAE